MQEKFTLTEKEQLFLLKLEGKMQLVYPKSKTLHFIRQFAYAYHAEKELPQSLAGMVLN